MWSGYSEKGQGSQERGPGTFALQVPGLPRAAAMPVAEVPKIGVEGGNVTVSGHNANSAGSVAQDIQRLQLPDVQVQEDPAIAALVKVGGMQAQRLIKDAEQRQYIEGAAKAASGAALTEIVNDQPWYTKIFGPTAFVEGARAYTIKGKVAEWAEQHMLAMGTLAEKAPSEIPAYLNSTIQQVMTGDPDTDQALTAELLANVPGLVKEHTKQHYMLLQRRADEARAYGIDAALRNYGAMYDGSVDMTVEDEARITGNAASVLVPPPGVTIEKHWETVVDRVSAAVESGNTQVYNLLQNEGITQRLPLDAQLRINAAMRKAAPRALQKFMGRPEVMQQLLDLTDPSTPLTREELMTRMESLNLQAEGVTGIPQELAQLYTPDEVLRASSSAAHQRASLDAAAQRAASDLVQKQAASQLVSTFDPVRLQKAESTFSITGKEWQAAAGEALAAMPPEQRPAWISKWADNGKKWDAADAYIHAELGALRESKVDPARSAGFLTAYRAMSPAARATYLTADEDRELQAISAAYAASGNVEAAITGRNMYARVLKDQLKVDEVKGSVGAAVRDVVEDKMTSGVLGMIGLATEADFSDTDLRYTEGVVMHYANTRGGVALDPKVQASASLRAALNEGALSIVGKRPVFNLDPADAQARSLNSIVRGAGPEIDLLLSQELSKASVRSGIDPDNRLVVRMPSAPGQPLVYQIIGWDNDGNERYGYVTSDDVERAKQDLDKSAAAVRSAADYSQRPAGVSEADWRNTRAAQPSVFTPN